MLCLEEKEKEKKKIANGRHSRQLKSNQSISWASRAASLEISRLSDREGAELAHREAQKVTTDYFVMAIVRKALRQLNELRQELLSTLQRAEGIHLLGLEGSFP